MLLKNTPIKRKLRAVILLTSGIVLLLTCLAFITYELVTHRRAAVENLTTLGEIMAENSTASLAFNNEEDARRILSSLHLEHSIVAAALYDADNKLFTKFPRDSSDDLVTSQPLPAGYRFEKGRLVLFQPVQEGDRIFGTLLLVSDLSAMRVRFASYGKIALMVLATSFVVAFLLSSALQKTISRPITSLAETARIISEKNDYSVRAKKESEDEIGLLTDAFNLMLTEIQEQQSRLRKALEDTRSSEQKVKELNIDLERRVSVRTAELEEAVSQMEAFSYSVSHDLRAPLRAMQGYSEAVLEDCGAQLDDTAKDYLGRIKTSAIRMDRLIQDILSYSRVARSDLSIENVKLEALIETIIEQTPAFQEPHAKVELQKPLHSVCAHEPVLNQCLANLLGNAVKFVAPGVTPHLKIWSEVVGPQVRISVQDNGIGIKPDYIVRIFGMFERIHNYQEYEGTGIGLAIVKKAVERMGGSVGVESQPGKGSRFWILLPAGTDSLG